MKTKMALLSLVFFAASIAARCDQTKADVTERLQDAAKVLDELTDTPDKGIPDEVLHGAKCVAVPPEYDTYSRSKGIFAGIDLGGSWIERDKESTQAMYGRDVSNNDTLTGQIPPLADAHVFLAAVRDAEMRRKESAQR